MVIVSFWGVILTTYMSWDDPPSTPSRNQAPKDFYFGETNQEIWGFDFQMYQAPETNTKRPWKY